MPQVLLSDPCLIFIKPPRLVVRPQILLRENSRGIYVYESTDVLRVHPREHANEGTTEGVPHEHVGWFCAQPVQKSMQVLRNMSRCGQFPIRFRPAHASTVVRHDGCEVGYTCENGTPNLKSATIARLKDDNGRPGYGAPDPRRSHAHPMAIDIHHR